MKVAESGDSKRIELAAKHLKPSVQTPHLLIHSHSSLVLRTTRDIYTTHYRADEHAVVAHNASQKALKDI